MKDLFKLFKELQEHVKENKKLWLIPVILTIIILYLVIATGGQSSVPVFVYPMV
jgi:hypothetical protein